MAESTEKKFLGQEAVERLIVKTKEDIAAGDAQTLADSKAYTDLQAENYDPAGTAATKVAELANGQVKTNTDDIAAINDADNGILAQAKSYADSKDEAIAAAQKAGDDAQADVDAVEGRMSTAEGDITTLKGRVASLESGTYDDSEVRGLISENAESIETLDGRADTVEGQISTLVGDDAGKSARTIANEELAKQLIADGAKESMDTLAEIAKWIQEHPDDAAAMNKAITDLTDLVGSLPDGVSATTIAGYIQEVVTTASADASEKANTAESNAKAYADSQNTAMDTRVKAVESALADGGSVDSDIAAAQAAAEAAAAADAKAKADQALADAKAYADSMVGNVDLSGIAVNASDIDKLEESLADGGATANAIADAKKAGTDAQAAVEGLEDGAVATLRDDVDALMSVTYVEITAEEIDAMFNA